VLDIVDRLKEPRFCLQAADKIGAGPRGKFSSWGIDDEQSRSEMARKGLLKFGLAFSPIKIGRY
jgi:hypothetical protein